MANSMFGFPNNIDLATLSGGSWVATLPRANLQNRQLGRVARTTDTALASTQLVVDQGTDRLVRLFALANHNISLAGRYRLVASADPSFSTALAEVPWTDVWPVVYPSESVEWEDNSWWSGRYTAEDLEGITPLLVIVLPQPVNARYLRLEIDDTTNAAGYVQAGRVFVGPAWQPGKNPSYGASIGYETNTEVLSSLSGAEYFQERRPYRVTRFTLENLSINEGMSNAFDMDRRAGISREVLWVFDPDDTEHALRRRFLGRFRQLSPIEYPYYSLTKKAYEIKELL